MSKRNNKRYSNTEIWSETDSRMDRLGTTGEKQEQICFWRKQAWGEKADTVGLLRLVCQDKPEKVTERWGWRDLPGHALPWRDLYVRAILWISGAWIFCSQAKLPEGGWLPLHKGVLSCARNKMDHQAHVLVYNLWFGIYLGLGYVLSTYVGFLYWISYNLKMKTITCLEPTDINLISKH